MQLQVTAIERRSLGVKSFELQAVDCSALPAFEPGAHIRVSVPGLKQGDPTRAYSLVSDPADRSRYMIGVLHVESGNGGSAALHQQVGVGDLLEVSAPKNEFRLAPSASHSILIAGGIGITPILSLTRELARRGDSFEVHYAARSEDRMAFREEMAIIAGDRARFYFPPDQMSVPSILKNPSQGTHVYVCGPHLLIEAVREAVPMAGLPPRHVHFESFGYRRVPTDRTVEVELCNSGITILVEPGRPLLEAIEAAGIWAPSECRRGECATCVTTILEGEVSHRDHCLTAEQRSSSICTCVSWATGDRLALDI